MIQELDEACAIAMGWQKRYSPDPTIYAWEKPDGERMTAAALPQFSSQHSASDRLLDEIERRGLQDRYLMILSSILDDIPLSYDKGAMPPFFWLILRATPEQRAQAFIKVMRHAST